jgi:hypothetical protein
LRQSRYHLARESVLCDDWTKAYYRRKRHEGKSHAAALRALGNQWVQLVYAMWIHYAPYDPAMVAAARRSHAPRTVASPAAPAPEVV